jgi:hypothetical protein
MDANTCRYHDAYSYTNSHCYTDSYSYDHAQADGYADSDIPYQCYTDSVINSDS